MRSRSTRRNSSASRERTLDDEASVGGATSSASARVDVRSLGFLSSGASLPRPAWPSAASRRAVVRQSPLAPRSARRCRWTASAAFPCCGGQLVGQGLQRSKALDADQPRPPQHLPRGPSATKSRPLSAAGFSDAAQLPCYLGGCHGADLLLDLLREEGHDAVRVGAGLRRRAGREHHLSLRGAASAFADGFEQLAETYQLESALAS